MVKEISLSTTQIVDQSMSPQDVVSLVLKNRHITDLAEFLKPSFPELKLNIAPALKLINSAIKHNQNILIYGDYDVDGVTATAILWQSIYKKYKNVTPFVPNRELDGYGIKAKSFFRFQVEKGIVFDLLITVDNGIVADSELAKIKSKQKIKIIVTDHHLSDKKVVSADALVHSTLVSGSAISWFLSRQIDPDADIGLAALGTVADCLPLVGVNRSLVVHGLQSLRLNPSPGIRKLINVSGVKPDSVSAYDLGFILGPRINAVGRLSDPTEALRLLCSQNSLQAAKYASTLNSYNQDRQSIQKESIDLAESSIGRDAIYGVSTTKNKHNKIIFVSGDYNPGIIGLIAGRLTEKYYLPSIVVSLDGDIGKGSCRSIPELNIITALREYSDLFIDLGGHPGAAGFSIKSSNIPKLKKLLTKLINAKLDKIKLCPHLDVDAQMTLSAVTLKNIQALEALAPFGVGNPEPLFLFKEIVVTSKKIIGSTGDHLKLKLGDIDAIAFKKANLDSSIKTGDQISVVATLSENIWNNHSTPQLIIKEVII